MNEFIENLSNAAQSVFGYGRNHRRVGVSSASVVESEGRVWVEVGGCGGVEDSGRGLKLRVTHLHPDNPAIAEALIQYRVKQGTAAAMEHATQQQHCDDNYQQLDKVSLSSREDFWFNHWQGPAIDPQQRQQQQQRTASVRRSIRRCPTCHKKVAVSPESCPPPPTPTSPSPVLAHLPSLRRSHLTPTPTVSPPDPGQIPTADHHDKSEDTNRKLCSSSSSITDDQHHHLHVSRGAQRVMDREIRTSVTMFADSEDAVDSVSDEALVSATVVTSADAAANHLQLPTTASDGEASTQTEANSPWRSRSCPCSPKSSRRALHSSIHSPASVSTGKFSLSASLWALHRQASNSLRGEIFHKLDSSAKSESSNIISKTRSLQNSIKIKKKKSHFPIDEEEDSSVLSEEDDSCGDIIVQPSVLKKTVCESHSLPTLKLSRMALTYRGGIISRDDKGTSLLVTEEDSGPETPENEPTIDACCALPETAASSASEGACSLLLPDLIPKMGQLHTELNQPKKKQPPVAAVSPFYISSKDGGVVNLGFDGHDESSDFTASRTEEININSEPIQSTPKIHGMSLGYASSARSDVTGIDVPSNSPILGTEESGDITINTMAYSESIPLTPQLNFYSPDGVVPSTVDHPASSATASNISTAPSTAQCSPSALRIRVMDGKPNGRSGEPTELHFEQNNIADMQNQINYHHQQQQQHLSPDEIISRIDNSNPKILVEATDSIAQVPNESEASRNQYGVSSGIFQQRRPVSGPVEHQATSEPAQLIEEVEESRELSEARALVYWWERTEGEYCGGQCGGKQKPLLMFVHTVGGSADDWQQQLWYFVAAGYEVVAPDLLGHGYSSAPDRASCYRFPRLLEHLRLLYDLFVPSGRQCVLMGHGYGCALVSALSRCRPSSVPMMVLAACGGPSPLLPPPPHTTTNNKPNNSTGDSGDGCGSAYDPYFRVSGSGCCDIVSEEVSECCEVLCGGGIAEGGLWQAVKMLVTTACWLACCLPCVCSKREVVYQARGKQLCSGALRRPGSTATPPYVLRHTLRGQRWPDGDVAFHRRITVPVLLLHGLRDAHVPLVHMCEMEKTIPRAFLTVLGGCGHDLMTDAPDDVSDALHRFLIRWDRLTG